MNTQEFEQWLERSARELPQSIDLERDLWPDIERQISNTNALLEPGGQSRWWPFVAGIAATLIVALAIQPLRAPSEPAQVAQAPLVLIEQPAPWVPEIRRTRNQLSDGYEAGLENLPPATRAIVEQNLTQIHQSLAEIHDALAEDPGNLALHRLLAGTYQQEIDLISKIGALSSPDLEL